MALENRPSPQETAAPREPSVLVIEPNEEHQVLSTMALGRRGFRVTIAGTAREGIRVALSQPFAAIVLDFKVRDMPALEVLSVLAERLPDVPKIFVVAVGQESTAVRALESGASGYLVKTARYNELLPSEVESQIQSESARRRIREQKKALGESEERFQKAFRANPVAMAIATVSDRRFIDANDAFLRLIGYPRDEVIGKSEEEVQFHQNASDHDRIIAEFEKVRSLHDREVLVRTKAGDERVVSMSIEGIDIEGEPCRLMLARDITEERRVERLRASLYMISEAANSARDLQELFRQIHTIVGGLMPAENLYIALYDPVEETLSFPYFVDEKDEPPMPHKLGRGMTEYVLRTGNPVLASPEVFEDLRQRGEVEVVGTDSVDWLGVPLTVGGRTIGVMAVQSYGSAVRYHKSEKEILEFVSSQVAMAIDRKRSEDAIRRAEARFRTMFRGAPVGIALVDMEGRLQESNPAYQKMFGYAPEELRSRRFLEVIHPDDAARALAQFSEVRDGARPEFHAERRFVRGDGTVFLGRVTGSLLREADERPAYVIAMVEDVTEQRRAQEDLEANERRFRVMIENITDGISLVRVDGLVMWQSPSAERMFGYTADEIVGSPWMKFVVAEDAERVAIAFADLVAHPGKTVVAEFRIRHKDGSLRWIEAIGSNLLEDSVLSAVVFNYRDITERNEALERIRFQASVLSQVRNAVMVTDAQLKIAYWNEYATTLFGWQPRDVLGQNIADVMRRMRVEGQNLQLMTDLRERGHWEGEMTVTRRDGSTLRVFTTVDAMQDRQGELAGFVGVSLDISDRVKAETALKARARYQATVADFGQHALKEPQLPALFKEAVTTIAATLHVDCCSVLELRPDGNALEVRAHVGPEDISARTVANDPTASLAAFTLQQGQHVIVGDATKETRFRIQSSFLEEGSVSGLGVVIPGEQRPFGVLELHSQRPREFTEEDCYLCESIAGVIANALERKRVEKMMADNDRLASMGQLAAYVAHEVNTPLTNISLLASSIARRVEDPEILTKLGKITAQRRRATEIITDLLNFPKQRALKRTPEDIRTVITAAVEQAAPYRKPDVALEVHAGDHAVFANIDPIQIRDVLVNLLRNAFQATAQGSVVVRLVEWPDFLYVSVSDTGTGMPPEVLENLFQPLFSTKGHAEGAGLGLAMSRSIVTAHGGKIEVVSEVGKGSTFTVILPRFEAP